MAKFAVYTVVHEGFTAHHFKPGDEVPEWAEDQVGAHCLESEPESKPAPASVDGPADEEPADGAPDEDPDEAPDFTAPKPRRNSRTRK